MTKILESLPFFKNKASVELFLFFIHNFFINVGTTLVYVSANVILLENHPEYSLPMAYILATFTMIGVGKIYEYYEHHLILKKLTARVLFSVLLLVLLMVVVLWVNHTLAVAVGIMVGFRVIYLLVNLEFWGVSALVFDVRQSKRLFSIIGSGDMPAKAIGAILAILIHSTSALIFLLLIAFVAFFLAFFTQKLTFSYADIPNHHQAKFRKRGGIQPKIIQQLFGDSRLVLQMCLGLVAVAAAATWIEYNFFVNVKYKIHSQHDVISFVGYLLTITYVISAVVKLIFSVRVIERVGLKYALYLLPVATFVTSVILVVLSLYSQAENSLLVYFSAAYLGFEVFRRTVFDSVFLVMFQPLSTKLRLKAHTLAKGLYEPLGMGIAGVLLLAAYYIHSSENWIVFGLTAIFALLAFFFLRKSYRYYLIELHSALSKRFLRSGELVIKGDALKIIAQNLFSDKSEKVLNAIDWLEKHQPKTLKKNIDGLLNHSSENVRLRMLGAIKSLQIPINPETLYHFAINDMNTDCRKLAATLACASPDTSDEVVYQFLNNGDLPTVAGAIIGRWQLQEDSRLPLKSFQHLCESKQQAEQLAVLDIISTLKLLDYELFVEKCLSSSIGVIKNEAIGIAGQLESHRLHKRLVQLVPDPTFGKKAITSLAPTGHQGFTLIKDLAQHTQDPSLLQKIILFCGKQDTAESRRLLIKLAQQPNFHVRQAALKTLTESAKKNDYPEIFQALLQEESTHAYQLLNGIVSIKNADLETQVRFELQQSTTRVFYLLMLLFDSAIVADAMIGVEHPEKEKRANALEILDNIIPRLLYKCVEALLDDTPIAKKLRVFEDYLRQAPPVVPIMTYILNHGEILFGHWTLATALRHWQPTIAELPTLKVYLKHPLSLLREAANETRNGLMMNSDFKNVKLNDIPMLPIQEKHTISDMERVIVLKNTQLFAHTPENVLTSIVPIMKEVDYHEGQEVFKKGDIGNCMFVIYSGKINIYEHITQLAEFGEGDFFGELALLDAEPRSASAVAETDVLLFRIDQEDFFDLMEERSELLRNVLRILCQRIRALNEKMEFVSGRQVD